MAISEFEPTSTAGKAGCTLGSGGGMSDPRVESAIAHWAPRFIAQGVDYNDFIRTTQRITRWVDWCAEWQRTAAEHATLARAAEERNSPLSAADAWVQAAMCHHFGK